MINAIIRRSGRLWDGKTGYVFMVGSVCEDVPNSSYTYFSMVKYWNKDLCNIHPKAKIGEGTVVHTFVTIHEEVEIGENCQIQDGVKLFNGAYVGDNVFLGPGVIVTNDPKLDTPRDKWRPTPTLIKKGAKLGAGVVVVAGATIGENAVIGAGSVVTKNIPPDELWIGTPARFHKKL